MDALANSAAERSNLEPSISVGTLGSTLIEGDDERGTCLP